MSRKKTTAAIDAKIAAAREITNAAFENEQFTAAIKGLTLQIELEAQKNTQLAKRKNDTIRQQHLAEIAAVIENARQRGSLTALSNLLRHRSVLLGVDKPTPAPIDPELLEPPTNAAAHLEELIKAARRGRLTAESQGSHVAAANYLKQERELLRLSAGDAGAQLETATDQDLVQIIKDAAASLPSEIRHVINNDDVGSVH